MFLLNITGREGLIMIEVNITLPYQGNLGGLNETRDFLEGLYY